MAKKSVSKITITDHVIKDLNSFNSVTGTQPKSLINNQVAGLYFYSVLDCFIKLAYAVSNDFYERPERFTNLSNMAIIQNLAAIHSRCGSDEFFPSNDEREKTFVPIFGPGKGYMEMEGGDFHNLKGNLMKATAAFVERVFDTGEDMLRQRVLTTLVPFQQFLLGLQGSSVVWSKNVLDAITSIAYSILCDQGVASVYGISKTPSANWPYVQDSEAHKLVEEISIKLKLTNVITRGLASNLQRAALRGAEAIATIMDFDVTSKNTADLDLLITKTDGWAEALKAINPMSK